MPEKKNFLEKISFGIIKSRYIIFVIFAVAAVYCALSVGRVQLNSDLSSFLPEETETNRGLKIMNTEFSTYNTALIMVEDISFENAEKLVNNFYSCEHITDVAFDSSEVHYKDNNALFTISFDVKNGDTRWDAILEEAKGIVSDYKNYTYTEIMSNYSNTLAKEMVVVIIIAVIVIMLVLLLTSRSYFEPVIFFIVFAVAALLNMGTNFIFGEISSITNSVAVILQLALAIDYSIIFSHRYQDAADIYTDKTKALTSSLASSIKEISSSSLTTIAGLMALTFMQFRLGFDLGMVLTKGIVFSMLTVFLLMPGLIYIFSSPLKKARHKPISVSFKVLGKAAVKGKTVFIIIFALVLPFAVYFSYNAEFAFNDTVVSEIVESESRTAMHKILDSFENSTVTVLLVPADEYSAEKQAVEKISALKNVQSVISLTNTEAFGGLLLSDSISAEAVSLMFGIDIDTVKLLYMGYWLEKPSEEIDGVDDMYTLPIVNLLQYLIKAVDSGVIKLTDSQNELISAYKDTIERGLSQLKSDNWDRVVINSSTPTIGDDALKLVDEIKEIGNECFGYERTLVVGNITSARDLENSYKSDTVLINIITILFVFIVLMFSFRSFAGSLLLVFVIQCCIWINFAFTYIMGETPSFVTQMIVTAIQMGATIDYAIVLMSRYNEIKASFADKKAAMIEAVNSSFPTIITSGAIMSVAGLLIAFRISDVYVGHIGLAVGRGAIISLIVVLTVLPGLILLFDKAIEKTVIFKKRK